MVWLSVGQGESSVANFNKVKAKVPIQHGHVNGSGKW